jgi:hypothetical protein
MKAERRGRGIALLLLNLVSTRGWVVNATPLPFYPLGRNPLSIVQVAGWAQGPVSTGAGNLAPAWFDPRNVLPVASCYTD